MEADLIRLKVNAIKVTNFPSYFQRQKLNYECIPLFDILEREGKLGQEGIANINCESAFRSISIQIEEFAFFPRKLTYLALFLIPFFLVEIYLWGLVHPNGIIASIILIFDLIYLLYALPEFLSYNNLRRWCKKHMSPFNLE